MLGVSCGSMRGHMRTYPRSEMTNNYSAPPNNKRPPLRGGGGGGSIALN